MSLKSGKCDSCGSTEIYTNKYSQARGERGQMVFSSFKWAFVDTYLCINCGCFEEYVNEKDFNEEVKAKIKDKWLKI